MNQMVRPKASDRNKMLANCFANIVTVELLKHNNLSKEDGFVPVYCKGPKSIYAALNMCLPSILREPRSQAMPNRKGRIYNIYNLINEHEPDLPSEALQ